MTPTKSQLPRANSTHFVRTNFPELLAYPRRTSRKYERDSEHPHYGHNWWFTFTLAKLERKACVVLAGALDYKNQKFKIFKVPAECILSNVEKGNIDMTPNGWINIYVHLETYKDVRNNSGVPFGQYLLN